MPSSEIYILNGPNLNLLGTREPELYGRQSLEDIERACQTLLESLSPDARLVFKQTNHEGELIDWLQAANQANATGVILNAGGYSHTSIAIRDAVAAIRLPVVEVHLTNVYAREDFRHQSLISPVAEGVIAGMGSLSYFLGVQAIVNLQADKHV